MGQRFGIAIHAEHAGTGLEENLAVAATAERAVDDELIRAGSHPLTDFRGENRQVIVTRLDGFRKIDGSLR